MKSFKQVFNEGCTTADVQPGNAYSNTGVTNHLTPVGNIVTQIRNLFSPLTGIVASVGEDGFSVKLNSSKFISKDEVSKVLYDYTIMRNTSIDAYIRQQGLNIQKIVPIGQYFVVYYCPDDIKGSTPAIEPEPANLPCSEMLDEEVEMFAFINESDDDEELKDLTKEKIIELINSKDKVKAAKQLELLIGQELELPREYYFAGVKSKDGEESIALRWKYLKKRPHGKTSESTRSLMNIFDMGKEGIWIQDYEKDSLVNLPKDVQTLIQSILDFLEAEKTNNPAVFSLEKSEKKQEDKKDEDKKDEDKKEEDKKEEDTKGKEDNKEDEESEDSKSRGDNSDDLLG